MPILGKPKNFDRCKMSLYSKIKSKIKDGTFREMWQETLWMMKYVRQYRRYVFTYILLGVLGTGMSLVSSLAMRRLIDVVTGFEHGGLASAASLMIGLMLGSLVMQAVASRIAAKINVRVQNGIQAEVYDRMLRTDWQSLEKFRSGDLINRLNSDVSGISSGITGILPSFVTGVVQFLGSLIIILCYDPVMALIAFVGAPVYALSSKALIKRMRDYNKRMKDINSRVMSFHEDSFRNLSTIKSFGVMDGFNVRMQQMQKTYRDAALDYNRFSVIAGFVMGVVGLVISMGCFGWGVYRLWSNAISYGTMTMFLQLANMLRAAFSTLIGLIPTYISVTTSAGRLMAVIELPEEEGAREMLPVPEKCSIYFENVSFTYKDSGETVLENVDFHADSGEFVAITGASGEGKTTMIRLMLGLVSADEGQVYLIRDGERCRASAATRRAFAYVPQGNTILAGTIADNLKMVKENASEQEMTEALKLACADEFVSKLPWGIDSNVGELGHGFSEGQAQRIAIARALMQKAPILILDEATSALDEGTEKQLLKNIRTSDAIKTCIIITHRSATANICERHYEIKGTSISEVSHG